VLWHPRIQPIEYFTEHIQHREHDHRCVKDRAANRDEEGTPQEPKEEIARPTAGTLTPAVSPTVHIRLLNLNFITAKISKRNSISKPGEYSSRHAARS
jgi:hypothetical protein